MMGVVWIALMRASMVGRAVWIFRGDFVGYSDLEIREGEMPGFDIVLV